MLETKSILSCGDQVIHASNNPATGAIKIDPVYGTSFTIELNKPIVVPREARTCNISLLSMTTPFTCENIYPNANRITVERNGAANVVIDLERGIYDYTDISNAVQRAMVGAGSPIGSITIAADQPTARVIFILAAGFAISFGPTSPLRLLGVNNGTRFPAAPGTYTTATTYFISPNSATFSDISLLALQCSLVKKGFNFLGLSGIIGLSVVNVLANQRLVYNPSLPVKLDASHLIGVTIDSLDFALYDNLSRKVGLGTREFYDAVIQISYTV